VFCSPLRRAPWRIPAAGPGVQVDRPDNGFHGVSKDRRFQAATRRVLAFAKQQRAAHSELTRCAGERNRVDDRSTGFGKLTLGQVGVGTIKVVGDDLAEHGVAQELEALVGLVAWVLCAPGAMGQRLGEQVLVVDVPAQALGQPGTF
jgi:hypothetical protein